MADRHWVGGTGNWSDIAHWDEHSNGAGGDSVPSSGDDVHFDEYSFSAAGQTVTVSVATSCGKIDWTGSDNGGTTNPILTINRQINTFSDITFIANMTISGSSFIAPNPSSTSSIVYTTGNNSNLPYFICNLPAGKTMTLSGTYTSTRPFYLYGGTFDTANNPFTCSTFSDNAQTSTKVLTLGSSTVNCTLWSYTGSNFTLTANTATINVSGSGDFAGYGQSYYIVNLTGTSHVVSSNNEFVNLIRTGTNTKTDSITFAAGSTQKITGTLSLIGNSSVTRLLVQSGTVGSPATLDVDGNWNNTANVDFMDINVSHNIDLSALTGLSGDCQGNNQAGATGTITFTTSAAQTSASTDTWSTAAKWTSRVPLPQDDVTCSHNSTVDMPRIGRSITFTGTPALTYSVNNSLYGSLTCVAGQTGTWLSSTSQLISLRGRTALLTLTAAGQSFYKITMFAPSGTYTLQDALTVTNIFALTNGTWVDNGQTLTLSATTAISKWTANGGSITSTGTIVLTNSGATGNTFAGNGLTYNNVTQSGSGAYALTISGDNTFNTFTVDRSEAAKTITLTAGTTQTMADFVCATSGTTVCTINSTGAVAYLTKTGVTPFTIGAPVYLSAGTAGAMTSSKPSTATNIQRIIGHGNTANELYFHPDGYWAVA